jgi:hypothetical protein
LVDYRRILVPHGFIPFLPHSFGQHAEWLRKMIRIDFFLPGARRYEFQKALTRIVATRAVDSEIRNVIRLLHANVAYYLRFSGSGSIRGDSDFARRCLAISPTSTSLCSVSSVSLW